MKRTRYYIKAPHHALAAMIDHGFTFESREGRPLVDASTLLNAAIDCAYGYQRSIDLYYIKPESEHLIDPRPGDIVQSGEMYFGRVDDYEDVEVAGDKVIGNITHGREQKWYVIKRHNLLFPPIEREEVEVEE